MDKVEFCQAIIEDKKLEAWFKKYDQVCWFEVSHIGAMSLFSNGVPVRIKPEKG